jgi:hypothetical protein
VVILLHLGIIKKEIKVDFTETKLCCFSVAVIGMLARSAGRGVALRIRLMSARMRLRLTGCGVGASSERNCKTRKTVKRKKTKKKRSKKNGKIFEI